MNVSNPAVTLKDGLRMADWLRQGVRGKLGITFSAGVSFNKVFAKPGLDMKEPDASTLIFKEKYG